MPEEFKAALLIMPLCVGLTEVAVQSGLPVRWRLLCSLACGIVMAWGCAWAEWFTLDVHDPGVVTMTGVVGGLMALGLVSGGQAVIGRELVPGVAPPPPKDEIA
jgi:hypothetical protein